MAPSISDHQSSFKMFTSNLPEVELKGPVKVCNENKKGGGDSNRAAYSARVNVG